jgi:hypothetical protein
MDFGKRVAWHVNQTLLQTKLAKCSYAWDGGTMGKYNYGCGCNPGVMNCGPSGPYGNMDKDTGYTKKNTGESNDVKSCACENKPESSWPKNWGHAPDCFWKGPAYYPEGGYVKDDTWNMVKWRVDHQEYSREDQGKDPVAFWNEVVVDAPELKKALAEDHLAAMPAIIYIKDSSGARNVAKSTAKFIADTYGECSHQPAPTIAVDLNANVAKNEDVFIYEPETESEILVAIDVVKSDQTKTATQTDQYSTNWLGLIAMLIVIGTVGFFVAVGVMMKKKQAQKREAQIGTNIEMLQGQVDL